MYKVKNYLTFVEKMHTDLHVEGSDNTIDEALIKKLMIQLIDTVTWLHAHNIVHRDLKLESMCVIIQKCYCVF